MPLLPSVSNPFKRQRTVNQGATPVPTTIVLEKPVYSKQEVQDILDEVERRYTQRLDVYCTAVREMLLYQTPTTVPSTHHESYIS
jgi:hypothetical protein